ncbi:VanZ family protein [Oceanobacter mangrovi]|uniref:VanZ family protein n=1 Tax=Oceanobacter mangrovi TaxID=2862510 RepID=UPI001C8E96A1|nr:VanZ family protein [Oceanobacter mangrovi]
MTQLQNYLFLASRFLLVAVLAIVVWASLKSTGDTIAGSDKIAHFLAYGTLAGLGLISFRRRINQIYFLLFCLALGGSMELLQGMLPHRFMGWDDMLANSLGVVTAVAVYWPMQDWINRVLGRTS